MKIRTECCSVCAHAAELLLASSSCLFKCTALPYNCMTRLPNKPNKQHKSTRHPSEKYLLRPHRLEELRVAINAYSLWHPRWSVSTRHVQQQTHMAAVPLASKQRRRSAVTTAAYLRFLPQVGSLSTALLAMGSHIPRVSTFHFQAAVQTLYTSTEKRKR